MQCCSASGIVMAGGGAGGDILNISRHLVMTTWAGVPPYWEECNGLATQIDLLQDGPAVQTILKFIPWLLLSHSPSIFEYIHILLTMQTHLRQYTRISLCNCISPSKCGHFVSKKFLFALFSQYLTQGGSFLKLLNCTVLYRDSLYA